MQSSVTPIFRSLARLTAHDCTSLQKERSDRVEISQKTEAVNQLRVHVDTDGVDAVWFSFGNFLDDFVGVKS
jgi:hypothetical protein